MTAPPLITVENATKAFGRTEALNRRLLAKELLSLFVGRPVQSHIRRDSFLALDRVSFTVRRGEALGVIGHNGAGKTTLLRMLSGEYIPDEGRIEVKGTRSNLVNLTAGFSLSMTGRENIYFRGAHLGFSREFLKAREQDIIDFAGIGEFMDSEVKTYSSGMLLRLGFAVSVFVEPDVLLVDEILAVGDFLFTAKCMRKMNELKQRAAIVYVSHSLEQIVKFTDKTLVLDRGRPVFLGDPIQAVDYYQKLEEAKDSLGSSRLSRSTGTVAGSVAIPEPPPSAAPQHGDEEAPSPSSDVTPPEATAPAEETDQGREVANSVLLMTQLGEFIRNDAALFEVRCRWCSSDGTPVEGFDSGDAITLQIAFTVKTAIRRLVIGVPIWSADGVYITAFGTHGRPIHEHLPAGMRHVITLDIKGLSLNKGSYHSVISILDATEFLYRQPGPELKILSNRNTFAWGLVTPDYQWRQDVPATASLKAITRAN